MGKHFFALGMEPLFNWHSHPPRLSLGHIPHLAASSFLAMPVSLPCHWSFSSMFPGCMTLCSVLPISSLTMQLATSLLNLSRTLQA